MVTASSASSRQSKAAFQIHSVSQVTPNLPPAPRAVGRAGWLGTGSIVQGYSLSKYEMQPVYDTVHFLLVEINKRLGVSQVHSLEH